MNSAPKGSFRLFRVSGIDVFLHWSWLIVAFYEIDRGKGAYSTLAWSIAEYLALFAIVLLHEFGHALACRQTGGRADQIMLWPLGGVAYVAPPQRPGAVLWSIVAGPLVNVVLVLPLAGLVFVSRMRGWGESMPDLAHFLWMVAIMNAFLLIFNLLPVYPLDGGQILRALLWFLVGRARSLFIAALIGFAGVAGLVGLAVWSRSFWIGIMAFFVFSRCLSGWKQARILTAIDRMPKRKGFACPTCGVVPLVGALWQCPRCQSPFDTFEMAAECPKCHEHFPTTQCLECGQSQPIANWRTPVSTGGPG